VGEDGAEAVDDDEVVVVLVVWAGRAAAVAWAACAAGTVNVVVAAAAGGSVVVKTAPEAAVRVSLVWVVPLRSREPAGRVTVRVGAAGSLTSV
jgi:hypothetical protein